jgi:hypothetical protein
MNFNKNYNADGEAAAEAGKKLGEIWANIPADQKTQIFQKLGSSILGLFQQRAGSSAPVAPTTIDGVNIPPNASLGIKSILIAINNNLDANQRLDLLKDAGKQLTNTLNNFKLDSKVLAVVRRYIFIKLVLKIEQDGTPYDMILTPIINYLSEYEPQLAANVTEELKTKYLTGGSGTGTGGTGTGGTSTGGQTTGGNDDKFKISLSVEGGKGAADLVPAQSTYKKGETVKVRLRPAIGYEVAEVIGQNVTKETNTLYRVKVEGEEEIKIYFIEEIKEDGKPGAYQASIGYLAAGLLLLIIIPKLLGSGAGTPLKGRF